MIYCNPQVNLTNEMQEPETGKISEKAKFQVPGIQITRIFK